MPSCPDCDQPFEDRFPNFCPNCGHQFIRAFRRQPEIENNLAMAATWTGYYLVFFTVALLFYPVLNDMGGYSALENFGISIIASLIMAAIIVVIIQNILPRFSRRV